MHNSFAVLRWVVALAMAGAASSAMALDRVRAIETAKNALGEKCAGESACTFDATRVEGKWRVRVDFGKAATAKSKSKASPAIFLINDAGRIVGRIGTSAK